MAEKKTKNRYNVPVRRNLYIFFTVLPVLLLSWPGTGGTEPVKIIINEVMVLGHADAPFGPQWVELFNPGNKPVNLQGMVIQTKSGGFHVISVSNALTLEPGKFEVLRVQDSTDEGIHGYFIGQDFSLDKVEDTIRIYRDNKRLDSFTYGTKRTPKQGVSFNREPGTPGSWCYARVQQEGSDDIGTPGQPNTFCDNDGDTFAEDQGDCNDSNSKINPKAREICNGIDDNCNGKTDEGVETDMKCKDLGVCSGVQPKCMGTAGFVCLYPKEYEEKETKCDGLDNDCDGLTDNGLDYKGHCLTQGVCKGTKAVCTGQNGWYCAYPLTYEPTEATCDGLDNDCNGLTDERFSYHGKPVGSSCTGIGICGYGEVTCSTDGGSADCSTNPGAPDSQAQKERCDGLDNNCNGLTDEGFPLGKTCYVGKGACKSAGVYVCSVDGSTVECSASPGQPSAEICGDRLDNDCDGLTDEADCVKPNSSACNTNGSGPVNKSWFLPLILLFGLLLIARNARD